MIRLGICSVEHPAAVAAHVDEANFEQNTQVFRNRGLLQSQRFHNLPDRPFRPREAAQDCAAARLRHSIERVDESAWFPATGLHLFRGLPRDCR